MRIKKNDQVVVMTGKDRGKKGRVMRVFPEQGRVLIEKINYRKVAVRRTKDNPKGGILEMEGKVHISKVRLVCPRCGKPTHVRYTILADKTKQRSCKLCNELLGA
jgi:large subunit ribosomal protein L24